MDVIKFDPERHSVVLDHPRECDVCEETTDRAVTWWAGLPNPCYVCPTCASGYWLGTADIGHLPYGPYDTEEEARAVIPDSEAFENALGRDE